MNQITVVVAGCTADCNRVCGIYRVTEAGSLGCNSSCKSLSGRILYCYYMYCYIGNEIRCKWEP